MQKPLTATLSLTAALLSLPARPVAAAVTFYGDQASFEAVSTTAIAAGFEAFAPTEATILIPPHAPIVEGDVTFTPLDTGSPRLPNLYVAIPGGGAEQAYFHVKLESNVLTVSGNENIDLTFSSAPTAVGLDTYTNSYDAAIVTVFDTSGRLIGRHILSQPPDTHGFLGITSNVAIGKINWQADRGGVINSAIDTVRVGHIRPHVVRFYLRGPSSDPRAVGLLMRTDPAQDPREGDGLGNPESWFSESTLTGTFEAGATFLVRMTGAPGLNLATTYRLSTTDPNGGGERVLGQVTQVLGSDTQTIAIPVSGPPTLTGQRLKLTISAVGLDHLGPALGGSTYVEITNFVGTP
jgi:hypothetical protein